MKAFLDFEEKSVEKAVQKACAELNISSEKLKYDIISYGSSGIFGLVGVKKALIRVAVPESLRQQVKPGKFEKEIKETPHAKGGDPSRQKEVTALVNDAFGEIEEPEPDLTDIEADSDEAEEEAGAVEPPDLEAGIHIATDFMQKIINILSAEVAVTTENDHKQGRVYVKGKDSGILIGKKGQTLEAIQYLIDKVVNKQCGKGTQIFVDVEGYVESREAELRELAKRMADKAQRTGKPATISRMNVQERRVVHLALKDNSAVRTQSIGDGYYRKLVIFPKKRSLKKGAKGAPVSK